MKAAIQGGYVEAVFFMGVNEKYPMWFQEEIYDAIFTNESLYTFWVDRSERTPDYYEKQLVEDYSVFLRRSNGEIFVTNYDLLDEYYTIFRTDTFTNSALVAFNDDIIEYMECHGGILCGYPEDWFYEYFTESLLNPQQGETVFVNEVDGDITITEHCSVMQNKYGEVKVVDWDTFIQIYDPEPGY